MLEAYSEEKLIDHDREITFDNVVVKRGMCVDFMEGTGTVYLRFPGVYEVEVCASCTPMDTGFLAIQLYDGMEKRESACSGSDAGELASSGIRPLNFRTYVEVPVSTWKKAIGIRNVGVPAMFDSVTILVRRL